RVRRGHQQPLVPADVVHRGGLRVHEPGQHRQVVPFRPLLGGEQHGGGPVGERGGVARGQPAPVVRGVPGGGRVAERRSQRGQLLQRGVGAQGLVPGQPEVGGEQVVEEAPLVGGGEPLVGGERQL